MIRPRHYVLLLGFALLPHITEIVNWVWFSSAVIVAWALWADHKPTYKPKAWLLNGLTLLFPALIYIEFKTLLGPDAATSLLLLMITLKLFEVYSHRDAVIILVLTLLLTMYHLVFRQDLVTTLYMVTVMVWTFYMLYKLHRPDQNFSPQRIQLKNLLGPETLVSIPLLLALFFFFPRFSSPIGRFVEKQGDETGFSEELRPGDLANMANSNEVAFRVEFKSGRKLRNDELYFRGQTLDVTDGINWLKSPGRKAASPPEYDENSDGQHYRITFEPRFKDLVFSLDNTYAFRVQGANSRARYLDNYTVRTKLSNQQKFQLVGVRSDSRLGYVNPDIDHTKLPQRIFLRNPKMKELVDEIQTRTTGNDEKIQAIRSFIKNAGLTYSFNTPEYGSVDQLLFEDKLGFCEHFASAATIMARALDVPSRVVVGFQGGETNQYGNYLVVRDRHAHAWMEYLNDQSEWQRMDPTSDVSGFRITQGLTLNEIQERQQTNPTIAAIARNVWSMLDNINNQFALTLLNMNRNAQLDWLKKLGFQSPTKRTIWMVFGIVITLVLLFILLGLWLRRPKVDEVQKLRLALIEKLSALDIGYTPDLGPLETLALLESQKPDDQHLQEAVRDYANLKYSPKPEHSAQELLSSLK